MKKALLPLLLCEQVAVVVTMGMAEEEECSSRPELSDERLSLMEVLQQTEVALP